MEEPLEDINEMALQMQKFSWVDYVVFVFMLAISAAVGIYWGFMKEQTTQNDYLLGGRNMKVIPVSMSLVASFVSGITLLGSPTEVYMHGTQYSFIIGGIFLMCIIMTQVYLPVFHELKITSNYEYLSMRFDNRVRLFGSILFAFTLIGWLPIVIYVPALAFNQVTGVDVHVITPIVCLVCIFYTSAGGLQAVVWTDVIQITVMFGAMALVAIKGTLDVGGVSVVFQRNLDSERIEYPNWDPNPTTRHTIWSLVVGGLVYWLQANSVNQTMVQRYLALPTLRGAKWSVFLFCVGISILYCFCLYCGLLIYARYHDCDPLQTKLAKAKDQLLPLLVMDVLGDIPGLPGVFVAGIFSAALSSLSTSLNSMSAVVLEDFYKPFAKTQLTEKQANWLLKGVVILLGCICLGLCCRKPFKWVPPQRIFLPLKSNLQPLLCAVLKGAVVSVIAGVTRLTIICLRRRAQCGLVFIVEKMGTILQLTMTLEAMTMGPQLGVFTMGILMPWVDATGALIGGIFALITMSWWCLSAQLAIASGQIVHLHKHLTTGGCLYNFTLPETTMPSSMTDQVSPVLQVSYLWFTLAGAVIAITAGLIISQLNRIRGKVHVFPPPKLLAPQIRGLYRDPPHPGDDSYIKAYDNSKHFNKNITSINMKSINEIEEKK